jgi:hypothetical protein
VKWHRIVKCGKTFIMGNRLTYALHGKMDVINDNDDDDDVYFNRLIRYIGL